MKKRFTFLLAALLLMSGLTWAQTDVLNHDVIGVSGTTYSSWSDLTVTSGAVYAGNTAGGNNAIQMRSNNNNSGIVTTTSAGLVTNITVAWNSNTNASRKLDVYGSNSAYEAASDLYGNNAGTLIGSINFGDTELEITDQYAFIGIRSNSGALYLDEIQITWDDGSGVTSPSISANNVEIAYDATGGQIEYSINNPVDGGALTAEVTEGDWLENLQVGETVTFNCDPNQAAAPRTATVTLTYTYNTDQTVTKNVTVTQAGNPDVINNIEDITATGAYTVQGTIVAMSTRGFVLGDGTGYVYYYYGANFSSNYTIGDKVKLAGDVSVYGGVYQYTSSATITAVETSNYEAEDPTILSGSDMDARVASTTPPQLSTYVQYVGTLTISGTYYNITGIDGATTAKGSISYPLDTQFTSLNERTVTVTGYYVGVSSNQYYNTMIGLIEEVVSSDPSIDANNVEITYDTDADEIEYTINNPVEGGVLTAASQSDWLMVDDQQYTGESGTIAFLCDTNNTTSARTATVTLTYTYGDSQTVTKDVIVTQDGNPYITMTIAEVRAQVTGGVVTTGIVTSCVGTTGYIQDATAAICVYGAELTVGDEIRVSGSLSTYKGLLEIINPEVTVISQNNTVEPTLKTIAEINLDDYTSPTSIQGLYVTIEDATVTAISGQSTTIAQGENTIVVRNISGVEYVVNDVLTLNGNIGCYNAAQIANPQNVTVHPSQPSISITPTSIEVPVEGASGSFTLTITAVEFSTVEIFWCDIDSTAAEYGLGWIETTLNETSIDYTISANQEPYDRIAYFMVKGQDAENNEILSEFVTITQAHQEVPQPSITIDPLTVDLPDAAATEGELYVTANNFQLSNVTETWFEFFEPNLNGGYDEIDEQNEPDWILPSIESPYDVINYIVDANSGDARSAYFKLAFMVTGIDTAIRSDLITINQPAQTSNWELTDLANLTENDIFVIVGTTVAGNSYAMSNNNGTGSAPAAIAVTVENNALTNAIGDSIKWNMSGNANDGYTFYPNGSTDIWLYCTNTNNGVRVGVNATNNSFVIDNGYLKNVATSRYVGIYNSSDWRCYTSINNNIKDQTFAFYRYTGPFLKVTPNLVTVNYMGSGEGDFTVTPMNVSNAFGAFVRFYDPANPENELDEEPSWIFLSYDYEETITLSYTIMETNNSYSPRTACFKYYVMCDNGGAWSNLITVIQDGKPYPTISITDDVIDVEAEGGNGTLTVDYQNFTDIVADVYFCDADGNEATYDWLTAVINNDNNFNIEYVVEENSGEARSAYFKVYALDDENNLVYSNLVTVNQEAAQTQTVLYSYSINGNEGETIEVEAGATITLQEGTDLNIVFTFAGWTTDPNDVNQRLTGEYTLTEDVTVFYAVYERKGTVSTIDAHTENFPTSYGTANTFTEYTLNGKQFMIQQAYINGGKLQFRASGNNNGTGTLYNSESLGTISSIVLNYNSSDTKKNFSINAGTSANPTEGTLIEPTINGNEYTFDLSGGNYSYFVLTNGVNAGYLDNIIINATNSTSEYYTRVFYYVTASADIDIIGPSIVPSGYTLDMTSYAINNDNPANLLIEGEVVCNYSFNGMMQRDIAACDYNENNNAGYYLIASPIDNFIPSSSNGFISNQYDLYAYNAASDLEWINFKDESNNFTNLEAFKGYLYANGVSTTLKYAGLMGGNSSVTIDMDYVEGGDDVNRLTLVGNSNTFMTRCTVKDSQGDPTTAYSLFINPVGDGFNTSIITTDGMWVSPMYAFFVLASEEGQSVVIEEYYQGPGGSGPWNPGGPSPWGGDPWDDAPNTPSSLNITVSGNVSGHRGAVLLDNAIVSFGEGTTMKKIYLSDKSTRLYIPQANKDYAVVRSAAQGEMPVNFKANKNGTYTIAIDAKNVEMNYLHLIDNMTGDDVDLLATPSYSFEAKTTDYASRFKLVFSANDEEGSSTSSETFAFFNGSVWCISNMGKATLQVVDVLGHIVSSETVNGNAVVSTDNLTKGVYMFRLVNGENVKVQKVVVK